MTALPLGLATSGAACSAPPKSPPAFPGMPLDVRAGMFGDGGARPYEAALRAGGGTLRVVRAGRGDAFEAPGLHDVARYLAPADATDREVLHRTRGAVLDVGCGPARIVRAALHAGRRALGVDVSAEAVAVARAEGLPVLRRSVFDPLPLSAAWGAVLVLDGNVGIGGDVTALLARCAELAAPGGSVVVEAHPDASRDETFDAVLVDHGGRTSAPFAWAEAGLRTLGSRAPAAGLRLASEWHRDGRSFAALVRAR